MKKKRNQESLSGTEVITHSPAETIELGRRFGDSLKGGEIVALVGQLGTGKTHLIKGIAAGLDAPDMAQVTSPTFVLINEYEGRGGKLTVYHIDAYRLQSVAEFEALGFADYCNPDSVILIEWADKILPALEGMDYIRIDLSHEGPDDRKIVIQNVAER